MAALATAALMTACDRSTDREGEASDGLRVALSTNVIRVGDVATLSVAWTREAGAELRLPELDRGRDFVILDRSGQSLPLEDGREQTILDLSFTSFAPGEHQVSTGQVVEVSAAGVTNLYPFPATPFEVASVLQAEDEALRPPRPLRAWPASPWPMLLAGLVVFLLAAAALGAFLYYLRRQAARPVPPPTPTPAHEIALNALVHLEARGYIEALLHEPFYVELSSIVRHYLENRFALHAPEQTTEEFIRDTASFQGLDPEHRRLTGEFLEQSDLVKFARHQPATEDMRNAFDAAERLVKETRVGEVTAS